MRLVGKLDNNEKILQELQQTYSRYFFVYCVSVAFDFLCISDAFVFPCILQQSPYEIRVMDRSGYYGGEELNSSFDAAIFDVFDMHTKVEERKMWEVLFGNTL